MAKSALPKMGVIVQLADLEHWRRGDARFLEPLDELVAGELNRPFLQVGVQFLAPFAPARRAPQCVVRSP
jgi:hypothetical protein